MKKPHQSTASVIVVIVLFAIAYLPALLWWTADVQLPIIFIYLRSIIYSGLFAAWGLSIRHRIIQIQVRRYLSMIAALMVFWIVVRELKYHFVVDINLIRTLWYAYYIPLLFIPTLGKPENYRLPKWIGALLVPTIFLLLLVMTNDLHQLVVRFSGGEIWTDKTASYNMVYWLIFLWQILTAFAMMAMIVFKCRIPQGSRILWLPYIPMITLISYALLHVGGWPTLRLFARDMTVVFCLLYIAILESSIRCGLIQSNTRYAELLHASTIGAQITDEDFAVKYAAENAKYIGQSTLEVATKEPVILAGGLRLSAAPIQGGYVFWQERYSCIVGGAC